MEQAAVTVIVDGTEYAVTPECWSAPSPAPGGYAVQLNAPLPVLARGQHRIELRITLPQEITDGFDANKDGKPDTYGPGEAFKEWMDLIVE